MFQEEDSWKSGLKGKNKTDPMEGINEKEDQQELDFHCCMQPESGFESQEYYQ